MACAGVLQKVKCNAHIVLKLLVLPALCQSGNFGPSVPVPAPVVGDCQPALPLMLLQMADLHSLAASHSLSFILQSICQQASTLQ